MLGILEAMKVSQIPLMSIRGPEGRDKQTGTALEKLHRGKGRLYLEIMVQFLLLVIPKVPGPRTFFIVPHTV